MYYPSVSIIISHKNGVRTIQHCIKNLLHQTYPLDRYEILVIDAGSTDGSIDIVGQIEPFVKLVVLPNCTEPEGQIYGINNSVGQIIMFTNSDIYVPENWIEKHVSWLSKGYDLVGGKALHIGDKFSLTWNMPTPRDPQTEQSRGLGIGFSNCSFRRTLLNEIGNIKNLKSFQDTEFSLRAQRLGKKIILDPSIEILHDHPYNSYRKCFTRSLGYSVGHILIMKASYGKLVLGSSGPRWLSLFSLLKEFSLLNGIWTFQEVRSYCKKYHTSLLDFLFIRIIAMKIPQYLGALKGTLKRRSSLDDMKDYHQLALGRINNQMPAE